MTSLPDRPVTPTDPHPDAANTSPSSAETDDGPVSKVVTEEARIFPTKFKETKNPSLISRYETVIGVLMKYGFADIIAHPPLNRFVPASGRWAPHLHGRSILEYTRYERMRMVCEELGTTFIKFAQIASNRPDLLPEELLNELENFQDNVPAVHPAAIKLVFVQEFGQPPEELFAEFDCNPIASASMAQVHYGRLKDGTEVVFKVQRPGIRQIIE